MFPHSIVKNLKNKIIYEVAKFVKRDYLEARFIKDPKKVKSFYLSSVARSLNRIKRELLTYNKSYGILVDEEVVVEAEGDLYWRVDVVDNYENFVNNLDAWGISISLLNRQEELCILSFSYYSPFLDECFYCSDGQGCFLNDKKLNIMNSSKILLGTGTKKLVERKLGSDVLSVLYCACDRLNVAIIEDPDLYLTKLAELIMKEVKGKFVVKQNKIICGNEAAVGFLHTSKI